MVREQDFDVIMPAEPVPLGTRIRQFAGLGVTILLVIVCLRQLPTAWLSLKHLTDPERYRRELVEVEVVRRSAFSITFNYTLTLQDERDVRGSVSTGPIGKYQYDQIAAEAERAHGKPKLALIYDTRNPKRGRLHALMNGIPILVVFVVMVLYGSWELKRLVQSFRRD